MALHDFLQLNRHELADIEGVGLTLKAMVDAGLDQLPRPGGGQTLLRFSQLAQVAGHNLSLCKLYEGHTDALAIMAELNAQTPPAGSTWGMWAAEPPAARVQVRRVGTQLRLVGRKAWCSGAAVVSHGLLTAWDEQQRQQLVAVAMDQPGVEVTGDGWQAVGMAASASVEVVFDNAVAVAVGGPGDYLQRPGFWQGGVGIAACWYGAAQRLAEALREHCHRREEPHALAHLGAVDMALYAAATVLRKAARQIDDQPLANAQLLARRTRAAIEAAANEVIHHVGRAMGAGPYCLDPHFAQLIADLPVYLRQSHAERDLAALGQQLSQQSAGTWQL
ncbi:MULTISPECIES: acyl-CoA dehydrogenase family protein [unclassified Pseudomonas]|uniref:acyl-CoA dehydrogenase family protein n=1 Tax=unclassified Pseudomonas TaxID=196821 RepID=UPI001475F1E3|nr:MULTISPECIES: acyl-CoA dehydrogenase family protein [unclassified Pseudomonas]NMX92351.1 acyl-CoA dehydrogenase [Pseudomonas sp. WS 5086]NMY47301.1 acyl-CoA dehydrogenase [Pseudomonas sp. WS 5027]